MRHDLGMPFEDIAVYLRQTKSTATRFYNAYAFMVEEFLTIDGRKFAKEGERKWSSSMTVSFGRRRYYSSQDGA